MAHETDTSALDPALESALPPGSTPIKPDDADPRASLRHVLTDANRQADAQAATTPMDWTAHLQQAAAAHVDVPNDGDVEDQQQPTAMTSTYRRNANGSVSSVFSGNRIRYLKKEDGHPLWRKDIQYLFLRMVFEDEHKVFTRMSDGTAGHTFADVYIDAMAKSSKTSQILKEKLLSDRDSALQMAMICLLVNVGRMNTTLNFFPEMRARVRTYHAIPCLQAQSGTGAYKQLQDGPRLKSILKGAMEDTPQPGNLDDLLAAPKPRTNPVNLIFVLSQYAPRVSETHFFPPRDFFDLFMRPTLSSRSRATAFLWLIWWYLESDFTPEEAQNNPFGPGIAGDDPSNPTKVPNLELISEEQAEIENTDTPEEIAYGEAKRKERETIVANDMPPTASGPKKGQKTPMMEQQHNYRFRYSPYNSGSSSAGSQGRPSPSPSREMRADPSSSSQRKRHPHYDGDRTRSPSPPRPTGTPSQRGNVKIKTLLNNDDAPSDFPPGHPNNFSPNPPRSKGPGRGNWERKPGEKPRPRQKKLPQPHPSLDGTNSDSVSASAYEVHAYPPYHRPEILPGSAHSSNQPFASHTPYSDTQYPYQRPFHATSPEPPMPSSSAAGPASGGGHRARARPLQTTEQSRQQRVRHTLDSRMQDLRTSSRRQRHSRGVLVDSWIKCNMLPDDFDSDEDPAGRTGGIDEVSRSHSPAGKEGNDAGDAGEVAKQISDGLRRIGRALDGVHLPKQRKRLRADAGLGEAASSQAHNAPSSAVRTEPTTSALRGGAPPAQDEKDNVVKVKRGGKPRAKPKTNDAKATGGASPSSAIASKRRKKPVSKKTGDADEAESSKVDDRGIPVDVFLKNSGEEPRSEASGIPEDAGEMSGVEETKPNVDTVAPHWPVDHPKSSSKGSDASAEQPKRSHANSLTKPAPAEGSDRD